MNHLVRQYIALVGALLSFSAAQIMTASPQPPASYDLEAIDRFLQAEVRNKGQVGLSVALVKEGKLVLAKGYGRASLAERRFVENDTLFAIGSVTKQFTSACVLLLAEEGKLSVQDKAARFIPGLTRGSDITLLDLMNHVSGYPDYYPLDFVDRRMLKPVTMDEVIGKYATEKLDFEPGTRYSYSNTGYLILGRIVEKASGLSFGEFLEKRILGPLGMKHTVYEPEKSDARLATGYTSFALGAPEAAAPEAKGWVATAGALYSTPSDLALWDLALMEGNVLKPESLKLMTTARLLPDGTTTEYGCGLSTSLQEHRVVLSHSGAVSGFKAWNGMIPSTKSAVILLANTELPWENLPHQLLSLLLKERTTVPKVKGLSIVEAVRKTFAELQRDKLERSQLADEFNWFLSPEQARAGSKRLKRFGSPTKVEVLATHERGGLEVSVTQLIFKTGTLKTLMYRRPDGVIEQFFVME